jgi:hypothetical protein
MNRSFNRLKYIFLGLFVLGCAGVLTYHSLWVWPKARCEQNGGWWAGKWMKCATPFPIQILTGRPNPKTLPPINSNYRDSVKPAPAPAK